MFDKNKIDSTLLRYLLNEQNEEERRLTENWMQENPDNRQYFEKFHKAHILFQAAVRSEATKGTYAQCHAKMQRPRSLYRFIRIAAVVAVFLGTGIYFISNSPRPSDSPLTESTIQSGSSQAVLHLSSGEAINLQALELELKEKDGTTISVSSAGSLNYTQATDKGAAGVLNNLQIPRGGEFRITLADGTKVWLNSETELQYPTVFARNERIVVLKGEAYFEVAKNPSSPFIVRVGEMDVKVYGTQFNINTLNKGKIETVLVSGSVSIINKDREIMLKPEQKAEFTPSTGQINIEKVNVLPYTAWKEGNFMFHDESLETIMEKLARWYNLDVFYADNTAKNIRLSGMLERYKEVSELFRHFEKISAAKFQVQGRTVIINVRLF